MRFVTLEEAKKHLVVEHSDDDLYIESLVDAAEQAIENYLERPLDEILVGGYLPAPVRHCVKLYVGTLYATRESVMYTSVNVMPAVALLLHGYKRFR